MESPSTRKACFLEDDNGLASIAGHGFLSSSENHHHNHLLSRPLCSLKPTNYYASFSHVLSPRSGRILFNGRFEQVQQPPYFLDACFLCKKPLRGNTDIFMYRGDTAFCSEGCRTEQMDNDEAKEIKWNVSVSMKSLREKEKNEKQSNTSPNKSSSKNHHFQSGAVAAA